MDAKRTDEGYVVKLSRSVLRQNLGEAMFYDLCPQSCERPNLSSVIGHDIVVPDICLDQVKVAPKLRRDIIKSGETLRGLDIVYVTGTMEGGVYHLDCL